MQARIWAEDLGGRRPAAAWREDAPTSSHYITKCSSCGTVISQCRCLGPHEIRYAVCASCNGKQAVRHAPSKPHLTDEYAPTDEHLWEKCLEVVNGERRQFTEGGRTINAPNDGRGYDHMPNPNGIAWAVKQYNGFGGGWKRRKEVEAHTHALRVMAHGGSVSAPAGQLDVLAQAGLIRATGEAHGRVYWAITARGGRLVMAGLVEELARRMTQLLRKFDPHEAKQLGDWIEGNFRVNSPKTPKGAKALKERLQRMVWVLKHRHSSSQTPDPVAIVAEIQRDWDDASKDLGLLTKFTDEGGTVVPKDVEINGVRYLNEAGVSEAHLDKYAKRLTAVFASLTGWRKKAVSGRLTVVLKPPSAFSGTVSGKYKREEDAMWIRTTPAILKRAQGYASFEYILVHELGHRYERFHHPSEDFDRPQWKTTRYSRDEGEGFAELFALGHFEIKGSWDHGIVERFESLMSGH